ncbi:MAG: TIM-barrel domain-containing protein, partial [Faecousia sp.]
MVIYEKNNVRMTLLTPCLLRTETGSFTDLPTQTVWHREQGDVPYTLEETGNRCTVRTEEAAWVVDLTSGSVISVTLSDGSTVTDFHKGNLLGTARTLDRANGAVKLESGIMSRSGAGVMDDSRSLLLRPDGAVSPRPACCDRYWFAYGHDYQRQLRDFFRLTGEVPLIPKFALGNWWSRYRAYTQEEYRSLMQKFLDRGLPVTVATIDMDWHWTDVVRRFGEAAKPGKPRCREEAFYNKFMPGWTGYSWNTELFPDHKALLDWLHENGFRVTLNVHPSQGIRFYEDCYEKVCAALGKDPASREAVAFNAADP